MRFIINADDFGYSSKVNKAIQHAIKEGLISSTTILVNMPFFEEAVALAKRENFIDRVGIHLNLFEGKPLTREMQECRLFCDEHKNFQGEKDENGVFQGKKRNIFDPLRMDSSIIYNELSAQIEKALDAGIRPTHLDSHGQLHTNFFIGNIVINLAIKYNISSIRINSNLRKRKNVFSEFEIMLYNMRIKRHGIKCVNYVGTIPEVTSRLPKLTGTVEIIVHPIFKNGTIEDAEFKQDLFQLLSPFREQVKISYAEL